MFVPRRAYVDEEALDYSHGRRILQRLEEQASTEITVMPPGGRVTGIPGDTPGEAYRHGKTTLVVRVLRRFDYPTCRPSADYALPVTSGCPGFCEYCYLITRFGRKPYLTVYANIDEILACAGEKISDNLPKTTTFEGAASSDPLPTERYSGALATTIEYFAGHPKGKFRFATKFVDTGPLLHLDHRRSTVFRFSINSKKVCANFERGTPGLHARLKAAAKVAGADYPLGFIIAPVILTSRWKRDYRALLEDVAGTAGEGISFEIVSHRFTDAALRRIDEVFPQSELPLHKSDRTYRTGRYGHGKYVYPSEKIAEIRDFFEQSVQELFSGADVEYVV